jgi:hypothetical protein
MIAGGSWKGTWIEVTEVKGGMGLAVKNLGFGFRRGSLANGAVSPRKGWNTEEFLEIILFHFLCWEEMSMF